MHIPRRRRHCVNKKTVFCLLLFIFVFLFAWWCFELCFVVLIASCLYVGRAYILMLLCFIKCMFGWSFALLYDHCSHFFMIVLVYNQVAHMFHFMFTWSQFTCYIILVLLYLLYLKALMCFVQVFQVIGIYVPSSSQLLWFMIRGVIW